MNNDYNKIVSLLEDFLGDTKNGMNDNYQIQFCCPECNPDSRDKKYNLEVNLKKKVFQCWSCAQTNNMNGKLSKLFKKYGSKSYLEEYRSVLKDIKASQLYNFKYNPNSEVDEFDDDEFDENSDMLELPDGVFNFDFEKDNKTQYKALNYLYNRGIKRDIIEKHNIKYTINTCSDYKNNFRIILPSYDMFGSLNFWTGRDYAGHNKTKYYNYNTEKKELIFNEKLINWCSPVVLVEGPFDHIVVPNSIPLLGKILDKNFYLFNCLIERCKSNVLIFLDNDAENSATKIYKLLNNTSLNGRVRVVPTPKDYDPASLFQSFGYKSICKILQKSIQI